MESHYEYESNTKKITWFVKQKCQQQQQSWIYINLEKFYLFGRFCNNKVDEEW